MVKNVVEQFGQVVESAKDLQREFEALNSIKNRCNEELKEKIEEIKGLEKALSYSSISSEARKLIEAKIVDCKVQANRYSWIVEGREMYDLKSR